LVLHSTPKGGHPLLSHTTIGFTTTKPLTWASAAPPTKNAAAENSNTRAIERQLGLKFLMVSLSLRTDRQMPGIFSGKCALAHTRRANTSPILERVT